MLLLNDKSETFLENPYTIYDIYIYPFLYFITIIISIRIFNIELWDCL